MPYIREGKCVYKENSDKTKGKKVGCSDTVEGAKAYMRKLYQVENEKSMIAEMSMAIVKASREKKDGAMRLRMVNSDTGADLSGERMSLELFQDFVERNDKNLPVPDVFTEVVEKAEHGYWNGGPPYLSIAHYKSGGGKNIPGHQERLYIDGEKLKSVDVLDDSPLGNAVWKSVYNDLYEEDKAYENPVRISIGFLDLQHKHEGANEDGSDFIFVRSGLEDKCEFCQKGELENKVYQKGHLVHKAFTRVPMNIRTLVEVDEMTEKSIGTKKEDAKSIVDDLVDELEEKSLVDDVLVTKAKDVDLEEYAWGIRNEFYEEFAPSLYVRMVTDKNIIVSEKNQYYKVGYSEDGGEISFDERSKWEKVQLGFVPMKSEAKESKWSFEFENEPQPEKHKTEDKSEAIMDENEVLEQEPVVEDEQVVDEEEEKKKGAKPVVEDGQEEQDELEKSAVAVISKVKELAKSGQYGDGALKDVQPVFNEFGKVIERSLAAPAGTVDVDTLATKVAEKLMPAFAEMVAKAMPAAAPAQPNQNPNQFVSRSLTNLGRQPVVNTEGAKKLSQIEQIARKSTGLPGD